MVHSLYDMNVISAEIKIIEFIDQVFCDAMSFDVIIIIIYHE